jgi:hypothetical protein
VVFGWEICLALLKIFKMDEELFLENQRPKGKIYKERAIYGATFFFGPLVAGYMMANNFKVFNEPQRATKAWIFSITSTILIFGLIFLLVDIDKTPNALIPLIYSLITFYLVKHYQGNNIADHINSGGLYYKGMRIIVVGIIGLAIIVILIFGIIFISDVVFNKYGSVKTYGVMKNEIYYSKSDFSDAEIDKFAQGFKKFDFFNESHQVIVYLDKKDTIDEITFIFNDKIKDDREIINWLIDLRVNMQTLYPDSDIIINVAIDKLDNVYKRIDEKTMYL